MRLLPIPVALLLAALPPAALAQSPEIEREAAAPQAVGAVHSLRTIPEACVRLQGTFTGSAGAPYEFRAVRTSAQCQPRALLVDPAKARPSTASGWVLNDVIRVPSADCPSRAAVVTVWRKPVEVSTPALDGQGRARIYLDESMRKVAAGDLPPVPLYSAAMTMKGDACAN